MKKVVVMITAAGKEPTVWGGIFIRKKRARRYTEFTWVNTPLSEVKKQLKPFRSYEWEREVNWDFLGDPRLHDSADIVVQYPERVEVFRGEDDMLPKFMEFLFRK